SATDVQNRDPSFLALRGRLFVERMLCRLDEFVRARTLLSADRLGRIQRCERFPLTSRASRSKHPNRNCPCGSASVLQPNRLRCVATRRSVPPLLSPVRHGPCAALARSCVLLPRCVPCEMPLPHD